MDKSQYTFIYNNNNNNNNATKLEDDDKGRTALFWHYVPPKITNAYTPRMEGYRKPTECSDVVF